MRNRMDELFCTPVRTVPKANTNRLSLSQNRKKKTATEGFSSLTSSQGSSVPDKPSVKRRPSCLSVAPNFAIEPVNSTQHSMSRLLNGYGHHDDEKAEETTAAPLIDLNLDDPTYVNSIIQISTGMNDEGAAGQTAVPPKIRVRSFAQYVSPKKPAITEESVPSEDATDIIVLSSDEEPSPVKAIKANKCATNVAQGTPKKRVRKKEPSTTTKIEVKRKITKSTNLKNITSKYFDASQTRIDNFFTVEKNPKSVGYYETFKKSEIVDFKNHSSKIADYESMLKAEIERMKESAGKIFVDVEAEEPRQDSNNTVDELKKNHSDVVDLRPGEVVRVHIENLHTINASKNDNHNNLNEVDVELNKENQALSSFPLERIDNSLSKSNHSLSIAEVPKRENRRTKNVRGKQTRKRILNNKESSSETIADGKPTATSIINSTESSLETIATNEQSSCQNGVKGVTDTYSTSDCSDFVMHRSRKACKRLSFTSSSTSMNLRSREKNNSHQSSSSNNTSVPRKQSKKPKITDVTSRFEQLNAGQELETINESFNDNNVQNTNINVDIMLDTNAELNASTENAATSQSPLRAEIDLTTLLDTPEQKDKFRTPMSTVPKFRGKTGSTRRGFGSRTSNKKKRNTRMECPSYKVVEGTKFAVDGFRFGEIEGVTHYFLTHFHADHYIGLKKSFAMPVYLSVISCRLVEKIIGTDKQYLHPVEIDKPFDVDGIQITAIDANHCPGAVMFLFKFSTGLCTLHTGDFRASIFMEEYPVFWNNTVHTIYLDTTYLNSKYDFKPQCESIQDALEVVKQFKLKHIGEKILFVCGSYVIGKEKIWAEIAEENGLKVWSEENRRRAIDCIGDERIMKILVDDPREANLHILNLGKLNYDYLWQYLDQFHDQFSILLAIRPSGWEKNSKPQYRGRINIVGIEYSEHSSYNELRRFIRFLQPHKIISTVPQSSDLSQTVKIPNNWYFNEVRSHRKGYQTSLTNYVKSTKKQVPKPKEPDRLNISSNASVSDDIGMLDATEISFKNYKETLCDSDYMS